MGKEEDMELISCPFCGEDDFDKPGLKYHLTIGHCDIYNETENLSKMNILWMGEKTK